MNDVLLGIKHLLETGHSWQHASNEKHTHLSWHATKRAKEKKPYSGPFLNAILRGGISQVVSATFRNHLLTDWNSLTANQKPLFQWFYGKLHEKIARKGLLFLCTNLFESLGYLEGCAGHITEGTSFDLIFFCHRSNTEFLYEVSRHSQSKLATVHKIRIWSFLSPWRPLTFWFRLWRSS